MHSSRRTAFVLAATLAASVAASRFLPAPKSDGGGGIVSVHGLPRSLSNGAFVAQTTSGDETTNAVRQSLAPGTRITTRNYRAPNTGETLQAIRIVGSDRDALHDPRSCLVGVGWRIENDRTEMEGKTPVRVCRLVSDEPGRTPLLVAYVYKEAKTGAVFADPTAIRARLLYQAFVGGKGEPIIFLRLIAPDPAPSDVARKRLRVLAADLCRNDAVIR